MNEIKDGTLINPFHPKNPWWHKIIFPLETNRLLYLIFYIICTQLLAGICELTGWLICIYTEISII